MNCEFETWLTHALSHRLYVKKEEFTKKSCRTIFRITSRKNHSQDPSSESIVRRKPETIWRAKASAKKLQDHQRQNDQEIWGFDWKTYRVVAGIAVYYKKKTRNIQKSKSETFMISTSLGRFFETWSIIIKAGPSRSIFDVWTTIVAIDAKQMLLSVQV